MSDIWKSWVGDRSVKEFLGEMDEAVAEGLFPDRRSAFVEYADCVLTSLASASKKRPPVMVGGGAVKLAERLLDHALSWERTGGRTPAFAATGTGG